MKRSREAKQGIWLQKAAALCSAAGLEGGMGLEDWGCLPVGLCPSPASPLFSSRCSPPFSLCCLGLSGRSWALQGAVSRHGWRYLVVWQHLLLQQLFPICGEGVVITSYQLDHTVIETDNLELQNYWIVTVGKDFWKSSKDSGIWWSRISTKGRWIGPVHQACTCDWPGVMKVWVAAYSISIFRYLLWLADAEQLSRWKVKKIKVVK